MSSTFTSLGIDRLPPEERLSLVHDIWESLANSPDQIPVSPEQWQEIQKRLAADKANPADVIPWEQIKSEAIRRLTL